jgi:hypothetical protein
MTVDLFCICCSCCLFVSALFFSLNFLCPALEFVLKLLSCPWSLHACTIFERVRLDDFDVVLQLEKSLMARPYFPASSSRLE